MNQNVIKSLVATFAHNICYCSGLSKKDISEQIESYYADCAYEWAVKIHSILYSFKEAQNSHIDVVLQRPIVAHLSKLMMNFEKRLKKCIHCKDYEAIEIYKEFYEKLEPYEGVYITSDDIKPGTPINEIRLVFEKIMNNSKSSGFSKETFEQFTRFWLQRSRSHYLIEGLINGFVFCNNNKNLQERIHKRLIEEFEKPELPIIFTVFDKPSIGLINTSAVRINQKLIKLINQVTNSNELKDLLLAVFHLLQEYDEHCLPNKGKLIDKVVKTEYMTSNITDLENHAAKVIDKFIHEELFTDEGVGVTGVSNQVIQDVLISTLNKAVDDFRFLQSNSQESISVEKWILLPNTKALISYRFYRSLFRDPRCHTEWLNNLIWITFWKASRNYSVILHPL